MNLNGVNPGDVTTLVNGGTMNYTAPTIGAGTHPARSSERAHAAHPEHLADDSNGKRSGSYRELHAPPLPIPPAASQTFNLSVLAPPGWTSVVQPNIVVAAGGTQNFNVAVTPPLNTQNSTSFNVAANSLSGLSDSVPAQLNVNNIGNYSATLGGNSGVTDVSFTASVSPSQVTAGQGEHLAAV